MIADTTPACNLTISDATIWGMSPTELHDRFWASRGVQVVRPGQSSQIVHGAELFLLLDPRLLTVFRLKTLVDLLSWVRPDVLWVRLSDSRPRKYRERAVTNEQGDFVRFERLYGGSDSRFARVALTPNSKIARLWQSAHDVHMGWRELRKSIPKSRRTTASIAGHTYDRDADFDVMQFMRDLVETWNRPDTTIDRPHRLRNRVWGDPQAQINQNTKFFGPVWVGAGRELDGATSVVGPAVLWDDPKACPNSEAVHWDALEHTQVFSRPFQRPKQSSVERRFKRCFDITATTLALFLVLPVFPLIMLAIWLEDGRPFFFAHQRETEGGRVFPCLKFRSMRKDADKIKDQYLEQNEADGPQFFVKNDPRLTRVGGVLRKYHLDELPQFLNVLAGHMSLVGPRPSPYEENQYSPSWREARLSVRPGITGLWQVKRTRQRGCDFQEWIKYDIEYVGKSNFLLDLWILWKTVGLYFRRR